jgi:CubicO group peptidase (beta-lactamase class C family)
MLTRAFACVVVLAALVAPNVAIADCSDRPPGVNPNSVVFTPTSDTTIHVNWGAPPNLNIDLIVDDQTANQSNINSGKPGGSVTGGLKGQSDYDVTNLTPGHNYRLTLSTRNPQNGCLSTLRVVATAATPSTADFNTCKAYAANAEAQRAALLVKGCAASAIGPRWDPVQGDHLQWCIGERLQHQTADVTETQARDDAINACHFNLMSAAFQKWMRSVGVQNATIADDQGHSAGFGNRQADTAYPIASLTKAITASCVATLVEKGQLAYTDTLDKRLSNFLAASLLRPQNPPGNGPAAPAPVKLPADGRANAITIAQLIRHTSGLASDPAVPPWAADIKNEITAAQVFVTAALSANLSPERLMVISPFSYNNANYAILGMMIEQATGKTYESYCKDAVLLPRTHRAGPAGAIYIGRLLARYGDVRIPAGTAGLGAFGGWQMSAPQYADFISTNYRAANIQPGRQAFMQDPASFAVGYGLGVSLKKTSSGTYVWHFGNWPGGKAPFPPTTPQEFSSYFGLYETGDLFVVLLDKAWEDIPNGMATIEPALRGAIGLK